MRKRKAPGRGSRWREMLSCAWPKKPLPPAYQDHRGDGEGQKDLPAQPHDLIVAVAGDKGPGHGEQEEEEDGLGEKPHETEETGGGGVPRGGEGSGERGLP